MRARDPRTKCEFPVEVLLPDGEAWAVIRDVHQGGAKLEGVTGVRNGQGCTLVLGTRRMPATICWTGPGGIGLKFQRRLLAEEFDMIVGSEAAARVRQSRRGFFGSRAA